MENYHNYVANSLYLQGKGQRYTKTLNELSKPDKVDNRTGEEIVVSLVTKLGLKFEE